jgi:hypothetical protein
VTTPDDDRTAPVDLPFPGTPAPGTPPPGTPVPVTVPPAPPAAPDQSAPRAAPDLPAPPPPPTSGATDPARSTAMPSGEAATHGAQIARPAPVPSSATGPMPAAAPSRPTAASGSTPALVFGVLLVGVGALLLLTRLTDISLGGDAWPLWLVVPGVACLVAALALPHRQGLGLAIAGAIITTVGLIVWVQETWDAYATWAYAWALVAPTAAGAGTFLYGAVKGDGDLVRNGLRSIVVGLALFAGFALFFEGVIGLSGEPVAAVGDVLPFAVIGLGALLVVVSVVGGSRGKTAR